MEYNQIIKLYLFNSIDKKKKYNFFLYYIIFVIFGLHNFYNVPSFYN